MPRFVPAPNRFFAFAFGFLSHFGTAVPIGGCAPAKTPKCLALHVMAGHALLAGGLLVWCGMQTAHAAPSASAAALQAKAQELAQPLASNVFKRPVVLDSSESNNELRGNIYAVVDHPYAEVRQALQKPGNWCEILMLHINTKYCAAQTTGAASRLTLKVGRKVDQPLDDAQEVVFEYHVQTNEPDYLDVRLTAAEGPLSTNDYRIGLHAAPLDGGKSFIQLEYSYAYGTAARLAMQGYLATVGRGKIGFTKTSDGNIGGVRGVVERNTMRYYLGIDAFLNSMKTPPAQQRDKRIADWFDATEQYAKQLHEIDRADYITMKHHEFERLKTAVVE